MRRKHCISVTIDYEPVIGSEIKVFSDKLLNLQTDSLGYVYFKGSIPDSIGVDVLGRNFMFYPTENKEKYFYQIWYYTDHKDVVFRLIRNGRIPIERDRMYMMEWDEELQESKNNTLLKLNNASQHEPMTLWLLK